MLASVQTVPHPIPAPTRKSSAPFKMYEAGVSPGCTRDAVFEVSFLGMSGVRRSNFLDLKTAHKLSLE